MIGVTLLAPSGQGPLQEKTEQEDGICPYNRSQFLPVMLEFRIQKDHNDSI